MADDLFDAVVHHYEHQVFALFRCALTSDRESSDVLEEKDATSSHLPHHDVTAAWVQTCLNLTVVHVSQHHLKAVADGLYSEDLESHPRYLLIFKHAVFQLVNAHVVAFLRARQSFFKCAFAESFAPELLPLFELVGTDNLHLGETFLVGGLPLS